MEHIRYQPRAATKSQEKRELLKLIMFGYNVIILIFGCVLLGVGVWMAVDRNFLTTIIGNDLYAAAVFLILSGGAVIFVMSFFGCCGAIQESLCLLCAFFITMCIIACTLFIGGILAIVFRTQIGAKVRDTMTDTLVHYYGIDYELDKNRAVTDAWDKAQERLQCCGVVSNQSWTVYRKTKWFEQYGSTEELPIVYEETIRPYVPQSCCVKDQFWRYINLNVCQTWRMGPPGSPVDGAINRALYYDGCFDAAYKYLLDNAVILIGLGLFVSCLLIGVIILTFFVIIGLRDEQSKTR